MCKICLQLHNPNWRSKYNTDPCWVVRNKVGCSNILENGKKCGLHHHPMSKECVQNQ